MKNSTYWEKRVANKTWDIYNNLEKRNKALMEIYQEASLDIEEELFQIAKKIKTSTPTLSDMHKYNRLGKLKDNINDTIKQLGGEIEEQTTKQITKAFLENYENTMKELGTLEYSLPNKKLVESLLKFPWSGENFSNRLWENTRVLERNLNEIMTRGLVQGKTIVEMATELDSRMMKGFNEAHRLVRTETMHYLNESSLRAYMDSGVKEVQLWAAIDERTCPLCGVKHGNKYRLKDAPVLPLHANCRCTYIPIIDDDVVNNSHDIAKEDVKKEWKRRSIPDEQIKDKMKKNYETDMKQYKKYKEVLGKELPKSFDKFQGLKYNNVEGWTIKQREYSTIKSINNKEWSNAYKEKVKSAYYDFRKDNIELSWHGAQRFVDRNVSKNGVVRFTKEDIINIFKKRPNYIQPDGRLVNFENNIAIIRNSETNEIVSIVCRNNQKEEWIKND